MSIKQHYDAIVIGSGPGGAITALELAKTKHVLLLEKGSKLPLSEEMPFLPEDILTKYVSSGLVLTHGKHPVKVIEGEVYGGGSEVNSGLYHRTPDYVLEKWSRQFGVEALSSRDITPIFEKNESEVGVSLHEGPCPTSSKKLLEVGAARGWGVEEIPRWVSQEKEGDRWLFKRRSMSQTLLKRFEENGGEVKTNSAVTRLKKVGGLWDVCVGDTAYRAKDVFVCCGATHTPLLLANSKVVSQRAFPLYLHPMLKFVVLNKDSVKDPLNVVCMHQVTSFLPDYLVGGSATTPPFLALGLMHHRDTLREFSKCVDRALSYHVTLPSATRGTLRVLPFLSSPALFYSASSQDMSLFHKALNATATAFIDAGAEAVFPDIYRAGRLDAARRELPVSAMRHAELSSVHVMGTCPMGIGGVCDAFGNVKGVEGLHVHDSSLFCGSIGVNPQGTVMMLARRNSYHFLGEY
jgi:choline dehydrogenase-like flavoprotein